MIIKVSKDRFKPISEKYKLWGNDKFAIVKLYPNGHSNYIRDLKECFKVLVSGIIGIMSFPIHLVITLFKFIPKIIIKDETIKDIKEHPKGQYYFYKEGEQ